MTTNDADTIVHLEMLARAIHDDYVNKEKIKGQSIETNPSMVSWEEIPEPLRSSNRCQSGNIYKLLKRVGCDLRPLSDSNTYLFEFEAQEIELLAELQNSRWNKERLRDGWHYAPGDKNTFKKTSPWLIEWDKLPDEIKEYDRNVVRELPCFLAKAGFEVFKLMNN